MKDNLNNLMTAVFTAFGSYMENEIKIAVAENNAKAAEDGTLEAYVKSIMDEVFEEKEFCDKDDIGCAIDKAVEDGELCGQDEMSKLEKLEERHDTLVKEVEATWDTMEASVNVVGEDVKKLRVFCDKQTEANASAAKKLERLDTAQAAMDKEMDSLMAQNKLLEARVTELEDILGEVRDCLPVLQGLAVFGEKYMQARHEMQMRKPEEEQAELKRQLRAQRIQQRFIEDAKEE